jgi:hypothetical protein
MSETRLPIGSQQNAVRVVLRTIQVWRGLGVARFMFTFEISSKHETAAGRPLWLGGRVEVDVRGSRAYLGPFQPTTQPIILPAVGVDHTLQLTLDVTERQLHLIAENRSTSGVQLWISLSGYAVQDGQHVQVGESQISHQVSQSDWISLLEQAGHRRFLLLELEAPDPQAHPDLAQAIDYFAQAQHRYLEGEWRLTVESLRQSLASLVGKKADDEEQEIEVQDSIRTVRKESWAESVGYGPRLEVVRQATKFMCDLGAHPELRRPGASTPMGRWSLSAACCMRSRGPDGAHEPSRGSARRREKMPGEAGRRL